MYLLYANPKKFGLLPPRTTLNTDEVVFVHNLAFCPKHFWRRVHVINGCFDVTPPFMKRLRKKRKLSNILILAQGGIGDSIWIMPFARFMKEKFPNAKVVVAVNPKTKPVWEHVPYINGLVRDDIHILYSLIRTADEVFDFGGIATYLPKERRMDPTDAIFYNSGHTAPKERSKCRPWVTVTQGEGKAAEEILKHGNIDARLDKIVMINLESSTSNRNWPLEYVIELTKALSYDDIKVVWLGTSERYYEYSFDDLNVSKNFFNLTCKTSLRNAMSLLALADVFVGPSSGLLCLAGAMVIPSVGLFGAFNPKDRSKYYDKFIPLWGRANCAPCRDHWTECPHGHPSPCMKMISAELVYKMVKQALKQWPRRIAEKAPII